MEVATGFAIGLLALYWAISACISSCFAWFCSIVVAMSLFVLLGGTQMVLVSSNNDCKNNGALVNTSVPTKTHAKIIINNFASPKMLCLGSGVSVSFLNLGLYSCV